jgi:sugar phosphate isomerase/epimerase
MPEDFINYAMSNRRQFLKASATIVAGGALAFSCESRSTSVASGKLTRLGVNLFSIPKLVEKDFAAAMKMLANLGYRQIEFYGPYPFSPAVEKDGWNAVTPSLGFSGSGFYGLDPKSVRKILDDLALTSPSMHSGLPTLQQAMPQLAEAASVIGAQYVILPSAATQPDLDGYKRQADDFNKIGESAKANGVRFAYHNHGNGLKAIDGKIPFDHLMENTDPGLVFYQMDIYWMTAGGLDLVSYLDKYKGRFRLMHIKDMKEKVRFSGDGGDPSQWIALFPYLENAGSGVLDLKSILAAAQTSGVEHFIVERDLAPSPEEDLRKSFVYLTDLRL